MRPIRRKPQAAAEFPVIAWIAGFLAGVLATVSKVVARRSRRGCYGAWDAGGDDWDLRL
jgi:hypothetical protein